MILPGYSNLRDWADSLLIDFPNENLPILYTEDMWKDWGNTIVFSPIFESLNAPKTDLYDRWQDWANDLFLTVGLTQG